MYICIYISHTFSSLTLNQIQNHKNKRILKLNILMFAKLHALMLNKRIPLPLTQSHTYIYHLLVGNNLELLANFSLQSPSPFPPAPHCQCVAIDNNQDRNLHVEKI